MLQFTGIVGIRMHIGDFLQFQCPFQCRRIVQLPADEVGIPLVRKHFRQFFDSSFQDQDFFENLRQALHVSSQGNIFRDGKPALVREFHDQTDQQHDLGGVGLRAGHGDFRTGSRIQRDVGGSGDG